MAERVYLFDTTLRDGQQTQGVDFTLTDKEVILQSLDAIGVDYIEGGWPGANPTDEKFFQKKHHLTHAQFVAFGMTKRFGISAQNDPMLQVIADSTANVACLVAKSWDKQIEQALGVSCDDNLRMVEESIKKMRDAGMECMIDAEHFFDGFYSNPSYSYEFLQTAFHAGASWVILCDTRGGMLPYHITNVCDQIAKHAINLNQCGIHCHNDTGCAVANSLSAVETGVRQVQCTINGLGERCGNADLISVIANLAFKYNQQYDIGVVQEHLHHLTAISNMLDERISRTHQKQAPYVGRSAFAHKGGLHVSAVAKNSKHYEHIDPHLVGNERSIIMSNQAGKSNLLAHCKKYHIHHVQDNQIQMILDKMKEQEHQGISFDGADASFTLLIYRLTNQLPHFFDIERFRVIDEQRYNALQKIVVESEATICLKDENQQKQAFVAYGNGPVNALDNALRTALINLYPILENVNLIDYKVRIISCQQHHSHQTDALTRVMIDSGTQHEQWTTVGVSGNIIHASMQALADAYRYYLLNNAHKKN